MKLLAALSLIVFVTSLALSQQPTKLEDPPWIKEVATQRIFYEMPGMDQIRPQKDLVYKQAANEELRMDLYKPRNIPRNARLTAVIFVHGGALPSNLRTKAKEWGAYVSLGQLAAASGFIGITFNHRFHGWDMKSLSDARSDVNGAIAYVRENAERLGVDKNRICLWSLSAGSAVISQILVEAPSHIRSVVFYYPIMDLTPLRKDRPAITDEVNKEFSPLDRLRQSSNALPPVYIARAGREEPALNTALDTFIDEAINRKVNVDFSNHPEGQHGFDVLDNTPRTSDIIRRTIEFIKAHQ